jgi:hypothetical protein
VREVVGFYDSVRKEDCTFQQAGDQRLRCLPAFVQGFSSGLYADAACQSPVASLQQQPQGACAAPVAYAAGFESADCGRSRLASLRRALPTSARFTLGPSGCTAVTSPTAPGASQTVALGDVIAWTEFVDAEESTVPAGSVEERVLLASDGARQHLGWKSSALGEACSFQVLASGETRCVPSNAQGGQVLYADTACTSAASVIDNRSGYGACAAQSRPDLWLEPAPGTGSCGGVRALLSVADVARPVDSGTVFYQSSGVGAEASCTSNAYAASYSQLRAVNADLTSSLPPALRIGSGSERLVPALITKAGTQELVPGWHDTARDVDCAFALASDGKLRCLPTAPLATLFFTDDACTSSGRLAVLTSAACASEARDLARVVSATCPPVTRVVSLSASTRDQVGGSSETSPGRCAKFTGVNRAFDAKELDPSLFVEGAASVE